jgi:hypothetical protein
LLLQLLLLPKLSLISDSINAVVEGGRVSVTAAALTKGDDEDFF